MTIRVALGGIFQETNTIAVDCTGYTDPDRFEVLRGDEIADRRRGVRTQLGGMLAAAGELSLEIVPVLDAMALPSDTIERAAYDALKAELLEACNPTSWRVVHAAPRPRSRPCACGPTK